MELFNDLRIQPFFVENQRHLVNPFDVLCSDDRFFFHIAKVGNLRFDLSVQNAVGAAEKNIGLDTQPRELFDAMLRRLGF